MSEIGVNKLIFHSDKVRKLLCIAKSKSFMLDESYPVSVELSLTNKCNLGCIWCVDSHLRRGNNKEIKLEILKKLILNLQEGGTKGITIEGGGEPTMYSKFNGLMKFIEKVNIKFGLITNGVMIPYYDYIDKFEWIRVSIDVDSPENYEKYKKGRRADYRKVFENLEKFVRKANNKTVIGVSYIATKYNMNNVDDVLKKLKNIGVNYFYIRPIEDNVELLPLQEKVETVKSYADKKFKIIISYFDRLEGGNLELKCIAHSLSSVISADSNVYLCGRLHIHPDWRPIGNLEKNTFNEIWNSPERKRQAAKVYNSDFTKKYCPVCRMTKFNQELYDLKNVKTVSFL